ncbi:MAG: hypothetical protein KC492_38270 [Myxococcales bacterium]|nr:hypothetical protein [Myxococcales bacterium]
MTGAFWADAFWARGLVGVLFLTAAAGWASGCGGGGGGGEPQAPLMDQTTAGRDRCMLQPDGDSRVFVVEWDATDLASFEAAAQDDVVFVQLENCQLRVLYGCKDEALHGRYGRYDQIQATSGTREGFDIRDQTELSAKLPLGAVSLGGQVSSDRGLKLSYFVAGQRRALRDDVYREEIKANDRCASATHFISSYDLGAFELYSASQQELKANAAVAGFGAEGKQRGAHSLLKHGGKLDSCDTHTQTECRVPIRLTARAVRPGVRPAASSAGLTPEQAAAAGDSAAVKAQGQMNAMMLRLSAERKEALGDGVGCLQDLERADATDSIGANEHRFRMVRAWCTMRAGRCDEGKKLAREALAAQDRQAMTPRMSDAQLGALVDQHAQAKCVTSGGMSAPDRMMRALPGLQASLAAQDGPGCVKAGDEIAAALKSLKGPPDGAMKGGVMALLGAARCAGEAKLCKDAKRLHATYYKLENPGDSAKQAQEDFEFMLPDCAKK